jgi:hypothetical protein
MREDATGIRARCVIMPVVCQFDVMFSSPDLSSCIRLSRRRETYSDHIHMFLNLSQIHCERKD